MATEIVKTAKNQRGQKKEELKLNEFLYLCRAHGQWFVI